MSLLRQHFTAIGCFMAVTPILFLLVACGDDVQPGEDFVTLEGRVADQVSFLPLEGVTVKRKGSIEDSTDAVGGYRIVFLNAVPEFDSLSFEREGYQTKLVPLLNATESRSRRWRLNVELSPN